MKRKFIWLIEQYHMVISDKNKIWHYDGALYAVDSKEIAIKDILKLQKNADEYLKDEYLTFKYEYKEIELF